MEGLLAIAGLGGAIMLIVDGDSLGRSVEDLPWQSPVLGGIALGAATVLVPLAVMLGALRGTWWAPIGHVVVGVLLIDWMAVEIAFIGVTSWLQPALVVYGVALTWLALRGLHRQNGRASATPYRRPGVA